MGLPGFGRAEGGAKCPNRIELVKGRRAERNGTFSCRDAQGGHTRGSFVSCPLLLLVTLAQAPPPALTLVFGGDVIPHDPVKYVAQQHARGQDAGDGWDQVFGPLGPALRRGEVAVVNLEAPVSGLARPVRGDFRFDAPLEMLAGLRRAGVTVASFANNHTLDQGRPGIAATRAHLAEAGLLAVGADVDEDAAWRPLVLERHGVTVALLAVTRWLNGFHNARDGGSPHVPFLPYGPEGRGPALAQVLALVRTQAAVVDGLVVLVHWGAEYRSTPLPEDQALAAALIDAGALAVVGHHPHVLQPVAWHTRPDGTRGLVAWSLGNLVSNQSPGDPGGRERDGLLLELVVEKAPGGARVARVTGVPLVTVNRAGAGRARRVQPVLLEEELEAVSDRLAALGARTDPASRAERRVLGARQTLERARLRRIQGLLEGVSAPGPVASP
jgi:poly-gamma-glutamate synthesis protein (capsule biosynthesis protein)